MRIPIRARARAGLVAGIGLVAIAGIAAAAPPPTTVFRCVEGDAVLYSDEPCRNATRMEVQAGTAAPDARERLQRDQQALDRGALQWRAAQAREEAMRRAQEDARARREAAQAATEARYADDGAPYYWDGYGFVPDRRIDRHDRGRNERRAFRRHRVISVPPPVPFSLQRR